MSRGYPHEYLEFRTIMGACVRVNRADISVTCDVSRDSQAQASALHRTIMASTVTFSSIVLTSGIILC